MEREFWEIVEALDEKKLTAIEAHKKLCGLYIVRRSNKMKIKIIVFNDFQDLENPDFFLKHNLNKENIINIQLSNKGYADGLIFYYA